MSSIVPRDKLVEVYTTSCATAKCRVDKYIMSQLGERTTHPLDCLDLTRTYVGAKGFLPVVDVVTACPTLDTVRCPANGLDNASIIALCRALRSHPSVTALDVSNNPITFHAGRALLDLVEANPLIRSVAADGTDMYDVVVERIQLSVAENAKMRLPEIAPPTPRAPSPTAVKEVRAPPLPAKATASRKGEPTITQASPRRPIPAIASNVASRMPHEERVASAQRYMQRSQDQRAEISKKPSERSAKSLRVKLEALERLEAEAQIAKEMTTSPQQPTEVGAPDRRPPPEVGVGDQSHSVAVEEDVSVGSSASVAKVEDEVPSAPPENMRGTLDRQAMLDEIERIRREQEEMRLSTEMFGDSTTPQEKSLLRPMFSVERISPRHARQNSLNLWGPVTTDVSAGQQQPPVTNLKNLTTDLVMDIAPDETELSLAFKTNVNKGAEAFGRREMDVAFKAWSAAVDIANDSKKKDWIAEITSRLQRLSFECLILQGDECATELFYPTAIGHFTKALNVAVRSGMHEWQDLARSKLSQTHAASFGRCRLVGSELLATLTAVSADPPCGDAVTYVTRAGLPTEHCDVFLKEWSYMLIVKALLELWTEAKTHLELGACDHQEGLDEVRGSLDGVFQSRLRHMGTPEDSVTPRSSMLSTSGLSTYERQELKRLHTWILCSARRIEHSPLIAITLGYLGNLFLAEFLLAEALATFEEMEGIARANHDETLLASALLYRATVLIRQKSNTAAKPVLLDAIQRIEGIRGDPVERHRTTTSYIVHLEYEAHRCLLEVLVAQGRYVDALEIVERCKNEHYTDLLRDKIILNFPPVTTFVNMQRLAYAQTATLVHIVLLNKPLWDNFSMEYTYEENVYVWAIPRTGKPKFVLIDARRVLPEGVTLRTLIQSVHEACGSEERADDNDEGLRTALQCLHRVIVDPIYDFLETCAESGPFGGRVVFLPDPLLWHVPFGALLSGGMDGRADAYLAERFVISVAPSVTFVALCAVNSAKIKERIPRRRVVIGAPDEDDDSLTGEEASLIAHVAKAEIVKGAGLDRLAIQAIVPTTGFLHVVAPVGYDGISIPVTKHDISGVLPWEVLEAYDLPAQVVGVSRCSSTSGLSIEQHGVVERLVRCFVCAGAASVVVGLWSHPRMDVARFFADVYQGLTCTNETTTAVTAALRKKIAEHRMRPSMWAGILVCGVDS